MTALKLAFMGTPEFAVPSLDALLCAGHDVVAVYCQPPRPAGRGKKLRPCPVQVFAEGRGLMVRSPASLRDGTAQTDFRNLELDAAVVTAYGLLLPPGILQAPRLGCLNVHASLLPRWRGAAPIQRAILEGDDRSGITIMQMDEGLDTGAMLLQEAIPITNRDTGQRLHDRLALLGGALIAQALVGLQQGTLTAVPQPTKGVTYAEKLTREEAKLDWRQDATRLERQVRAFTPWPGAWFEARGERLRVLDAKVVDCEGAALPGTLLDQHLTVACGAQALRVTRLQRAGRAPMAAADLLRGFSLEPGLLLT